MELKLKQGKYLYPATIESLPGKILSVRFAFNRELKDEVKSMEGARWNPEKKIWTVADSHRNWFQFRFLSALKPEQSPYTRYDVPCEKLKITRFNKALNRNVTLYAHQGEMVSHGLLHRQCIIAGEMGTGKTVAFIEIMERSGTTDWWYVAPRSVLRAIEREFIIWDAKIRPRLMTYEEVVKEMKNWIPGRKAPKGIIFDESSRIKNHTSQRSQAAKGLADGVRSDWGYDGYVILGTGTPAPKSPADWWHQCEVACPGFLKEGDIFKFRNRLGIVVQKNSITGGVYPQLVTWRDDSKKCNVCGRATDHVIHCDPNSAEAIIAEASLPPDEKLHTFIPSVNELHNLYLRMAGLVLVKFKKDCVDLPDKQYRIVEVKPSQSTLRVAKLLVNASKTVIAGLTLLRELSDGFQYTKTKEGMEFCPRCAGTKVVSEPTEIPDSCPHCTNEATRELNEAGFPVECLDHKPRFTEAEVSVSCPKCSGTGEVARYIRTVKSVACPKDDALVDLLDEYEEVGRVVIYGGFTGAIDRIVQLAHKSDWAVIRVDQGKWIVTDTKGVAIGMDPLELFQNATSEHREKFPRVAFVAHPKSGGMGLTLTASPVIIYFSNDHDGEARTQSEDRIHRLGMDLNRGAMIIDIFHLPTDRKVYENLKKKRMMELMTLGEISEGMNESKEAVTFARSVV